MFPTLERPHPQPRCWQVLERVAVDEQAHTVTSLTDHFTNMINATVAVPEHPEGTQFDPNQLKGDPAGGPQPPG